MKKLFALVLIAVLMLSLTGCFGKSGSSSTEPTTPPPALSTYTKDFFGLQQYLVDYGYVASVDLSKYNPASNDEPAADATSGNRTAVYYDLLGADNGIRFVVGGTVFIEIYDFSSADNDTAKKVLADLKANGKVTVAEGLDELTGVISKSGKYVILYNAKNAYDGYSEITKVLENW